MSVVAHITADISDVDLSLPTIAQLAMFDPSSLPRDSRPGNSPCARRHFFKESREHARGFTLIELLVTLSVVGILSTLAATSFSTTITNNRVYGIQTEFTAFLALARSEATRRGVPVVVSADAPVTGNEYGAGWKIWVDQNADGSFSSSETVVRKHEALPRSAVITGASSIAYGPMGFLMPASAIDIKICATDASRSGYQITIQPNGMADVTPLTVCS
jgi:type IV fimbrial biogenesis protein FimT